MISGLGLSQPNLTKPFCCDDSGFDYPVMEGRHFMVTFCLPPSAWWLFGLHSVGSGLKTRRGCRSPVVNSAEMPGVYLTQSVGCQSILNFHFAASNKCKQRTRNLSCIAVIGYRAKSTFIGAFSVYILLQNQEELWTGCGICSCNQHSLHFRQQAKMVQMILFPNTPSNLWYYNQMLSESDETERILCPISIFSFQTG